MDKGDTTSEDGDSPEEGSAKEAVSTSGPSEGGAAISAPAEPNRNLAMLQECQMALRKDEDGDLPLHIAVAQEDVDAVDKVIAMMQTVGTSLDHYNNLRQTPLHLAVILKHTGIIERLLQGGANPGLPDRNGLNAVHHAIDKECLHSLQLVLTRCEVDDLNCKNYDGISPLHLAVQKGSIPAARMILGKQGVNINIQDGKSGRTPLFHAAENNMESICDLLLKHSANPNLQNYGGSTAVSAASGRGYSNIVALLVKHGADAYFRDAIIANTAQVKQALKDTIRSKQDSKGGNSFRQRPEASTSTSGKKHKNVMPNPEAAMTTAGPKSKRAKFVAAAAETSAAASEASALSSHRVSSPGHLSGSPTTPTHPRTPTTPTQPMTPTYSATPPSTPRVLSPPTAPVSPVPNSPVRNVTSGGPVSPAPLPPGAEEPCPAPASMATVTVESPRATATVPVSVLPPVNSPVPGEDKKV